MTKRTVTSPKVLYSAVRRIPAWSNWNRDTCYKQSTDTKFPITHRPELKISHSHIRIMKGSGIVDVNTVRNSESSNTSVLKKKSEVTDKNCNDNINDWVILLIKWTFFSLSLHWRLCNGGATYANHISEGKQQKNLPRTPWMLQILCHRWWKMTDDHKHKSKS